MTAEEKGNNKMEKNLTLLEAEGVSKQYTLGMIGGKTLQAELASWIARKRGKTDPNRKIGTEHLQYGEKFWALKDVSFSVQKGDAIALLGRNGAGKSTMLKLISRITLPTEGCIRIRGKVASLLEVGTGFHPELSGRDNIYLNGLILGMNRAEINAKMKDIIDFSEIEAHIDTPVKRYSSGMRVKLGFAVAAHLNPEIMICDEVLAVGDLAFQKKCLAKMQEIANDGRAVLYVSHNMRTVTELCNRGLFLEQGKLTYDGTVERAMELYGGSSARSSYRNLDEVSRSKTMGQTMRMESIQFLDTQSLEYDQDAEMTFRLSWTAHLAEPRLRVRLILQNSIGAPLAMTETEAFDIRAEEKVTRQIRFRLKGIAPGEYVMALALIAVTPKGRTTSFDYIQDVSRFVIRDDPALNDGFVWIERKWGNMRLPALQMQEEKENA